MPKSTIKPGDRFGRLTIIKHQSTGARGRIWLCRCDCGKDKLLTSSKLPQQNSCGCGRDLSGPRTHMMSKSCEYRVWRSMKARCENQSDHGFSDYGGRGISICIRWANSFEAFYADMGPRPGKGYSIDRKDNDGNYEPGNCRWATAAEQQSNRRYVRQIEYEGQTVPLFTLAARFNLNRVVFLNRIRRGWSLQRALTQPVRTITRR